MRPRIIINLLALTCVVALAIAPAAGAMTDQGSPDAHGVAPTPSVSLPSDMRSPDTRDLAPTPSVSLPADLRSPDTRDAAIGRTTSATPAPVVVHTTSSDGFDWGDASIGAGALLLVLTLTGGLSVLAVHRRRDHQGSAAVPSAH